MPGKGSQLYLKIESLEISVSFQCTFQVIMTVDDNRYESKIMNASPMPVIFDDTFAFRSYQEQKVSFHIMIRCSKGRKMCGQCSLTTTTNEIQKKLIYKLRLEKCPDPNAHLRIVIDNNPWFTSNLTTLNSQSQVQKELNLTEETQQLTTCMMTLSDLDQSQYRSTVSNLTDFYDIPPNLSSDFYNANELEQQNDNFHSFINDSQTDNSLQGNILDQLETCRHEVIDQQVECDLPTEKETLLAAQLRKIEQQSRGIEDTSIECNVHHILYDEDNRHQTVFLRTLKKNTDLELENQSQKMHIDLLLAQITTLRGVQEQLQIELLRSRQKLGDLMNLAFEKGNNYSDLVETMMLRQH